MVQGVPRRIDVDTFALTVADTPTELVAAERLDLSAYGFELADVSLVPTREVSLEEWAACGPVLKAEYLTLQKRATWIQFAIGDWLNFGEAHYGDEIWNYLSPADYDADTLHNFKSVSKHVASSLRNENLTYSHHVAVAGLLADRQAVWLDKAERERMTVAALREQVNAEKGIDPRAHLVTCPNCGVRFEP